jgi:hypothetical protein
VGFIACTNSAPVVPSYITGSNRLMSAMRRTRRLEVAFGAPIPPCEASTGDDYRAFAKKVASEIARLRQEVEGI